MHALVTVDELAQETGATLEQVDREAEYLASSGLLKDFTEQGLAYMPTAPGIQAAERSEPSSSLVPERPLASADRDAVTGLAVRRVFDEDLLAWPITRCTLPKPPAEIALSHTL
jgi:hypothetical protein